MPRSNWMASARGTLFSMGLAGLVLISIWLPEFSHWYVNPMSASATMVESARTTPEQRVLEEVVAMRVGAVTIASEDVVRVAELMLQGSLDLSGFQPSAIVLPFHPSDLERGTPTFQLAVASLVSADIFLDAYRLSKREQYLISARDVIVAFARYEARRWLDRGMMWNDHAIAARVPVLVKFWAEYRSHPGFDPRVGRLVLDLVARSARLLAKPDFYAWRTGHGIVADVALLQMAVAFPELDGVSELRLLAAKRFGAHLPYWINSEGVTLLHSAGYHSPGLFGLVLRLYSLNGISIPQDWWQRYASALQFDNLLRRSDGTLPMYGDTMSVPRPASWVTSQRAIDGGAQAMGAPLSVQPRDGLSVFPAAGHAILWDRQPPGGSPDVDAAQTVVTWSYYPGLGHKIADELSLIVWAGGRTWITNTGYWPYGVAGRAQAESWDASNAPHLSEESKNSVRVSRVRGLGQETGATLIDLERAGPEGYIVRRQIVRLVDQNAWLVLDGAKDNALRASTTHWTFYPDLTVTALAASGTYSVASSDSSQTMVSAFSGSQAVNVNVVRGQSPPPTGWVVLDRTPTPASSVIVRQPTRDSWSLATFALVKSGQAAVPTLGGRMLSWLDGDHWAVEMPSAAGPVKLTRTGSQLLLHTSRDSKLPRLIDIKSIDSPDPQIRLVQAAISHAAENFHKFRELIAYRITISYILLMVLISQELAMCLLRRKRPDFAGPARIALLIGWTTVGIGLSQVYLQAPS